MISIVWKTRSKKVLILNLISNRRFMNCSRAFTKSQTMLMLKIIRLKLAKPNLINWSNQSTDLLKFSSRNLFTLTMKQFAMRLLVPKFRDLLLKTTVWRPMSLRLRIAIPICLMFKEKWLSREILRHRKVVTFLPSSSSTKINSLSLRVRPRHLARILMPLRIAMITCCREIVGWRKNLLPFKSMQTWSNSKTKIFRENLMNSWSLMILSDLDLTVVIKSITLDSVSKQLLLVPSLTLKDLDHPWEVETIIVPASMTNLLNKKIWTNRVKHQLPHSIMITSHKLKKTAVIALPLLTDAILRARAHL